MGRGTAPSEAAEAALLKMAEFYPTFSGAIIATTIAGEYGAACYGFSYFEYTIASPNITDTEMFHMNCMH